MFDAVLFDLDGTLLDIDMDLFIQNYFKKMFQMAREGGLPTEGLIERLWRGTAAMIDNKDPALTNLQVFGNYFFTGPTFKQETFQPFFDDFYNRGFDQLKDFARAFPLAEHVVDAVFSSGSKVAIATQPVFPEVAIRKRMSWAGVGDFSYDLVTSYETMHFTKPHPEYYLEITNALGVDPANCLMVGNDVGEDLAAARTGMKTFLVKERMLNRNNLPINVDWQGYLPDLLDLFKKKRFISWGMDSGQTCSG